MQVSAEGRRRAAPLFSAFWPFFGKTLFPEAEIPKKAKFKVSLGG